MFHAMMYREHADYDAQWHEWLVLIYISIARHYIVIDTDRVKELNAFRQAMLVRHFIV